MRRFSRTGSQRRVGVPSTSTSPALGKSKPFTILSAVVLPEPLRPSSTNVSPASTERVKLFRISRAPMRYDAARNSLNDVADAALQPHRLPAASRRAIHQHFAGAGEVL